jgi:hypothetical protein
MRSTWVGAPAPTCALRPTARTGPAGRRSEARRAPSWDRARAATPFTCSCVTEPGSSPRSSLTPSCSTRAVRNSPLRPSDWASRRLGRERPVTRQVPAPSPQAPPSTTPALSRTRASPSRSAGKPATRSGLVDASLRRRWPCRAQQAPGTAEAAIRRRGRQRPSSLALMRVTVTARDGVGNATRTLRHRGGDRRRILRARPGVSVRAGVGVIARRGPDLVEPRSIDGEPVGLVDSTRPLPGARDEGGDLSPADPRTSRGRPGPVTRQHGDRGPRRRLVTLADA